MPLMTETKLNYLPDAHEGEYSRDTSPLGVRLQAFCQGSGLPAGNKA